jgi:uncharacterized protein YktB (UPF0637 family)
MLLKYLFRMKKLIAENQKILSENSILRADLEKKEEAINSLQKDHVSDMFEYLQKISELETLLNQLRDINAELIRENSDLLSELIETRTQLLECKKELV